MSSSSVFRIRKASVRGKGHENAIVSVNNEDATETDEFSIPRWGKTFRVGLAADGVSGIPAFSHSEIGANLLVIYCLARIQELIVGGVRLEDLPMPLYHAMTSFLRDFANMVMPENIVWRYPIKFKGSEEFRNSIKATQRFKIDYLAATLLGFVDDGETLVTFQAGDGVIIIDGNIMVVDQNDRPEYPVLSINTPGRGFDTKVYRSEEVYRIALATDGLEELLKVPEINLPGILFTHEPNNPMGLQLLLNGWRQEYGQQMKDDCTVVTRERIEEVANATTTA